MNKNYEDTLPSGYVQAFTVDAKSKKTAIVFNVVSLIIAIVGILIAFFTLKPIDLEELFSWRYYIAFCILILYVVLHELTHGVAYKLLTGKKLTFGVSLSCAYCGIPDTYVYRRCSMISMLAPFVVFTIAFAIPIFLLPTATTKLLSASLLSIHIGGCVGDLYGAFLFLTKFRDSTVLMRDTGPMQIFYTVGDKSDE